MVNKPNQYDLIREYLLETTGVVLDQSKNYLIDTRLAPLLREHKIPNLEELVIQLKKPSSTEILEGIVTALTTHETYFFRDDKPFELITTKIIPEIIAKNQKQRTIRIWSAACSYGQEIYSVAMILGENKDKLQNWDINLVGTDISVGTLDKAKKATYTSQEVSRGLPQSYLNKYFKAIGDSWVFQRPSFVNIEFKLTNLNEKFESLGLFDLILLRNVLIYFDLEAKKSILKNLTKVLPIGGYLILGTAETTTNLVDCFARHNHNSSVYFVHTPS